MRIGIDVGSTTAKLVAIDSEGNVLHTDYRRHNARAREVVCEMLDGLLPVVGADQSLEVHITGSVGMGLSERYGFPFVQEVVAAARAIRKDHPEVASMIDIGGEDAKVVFFRNGEPADLRMNGNCAGGTGAFIDQMAVILGIDVRDLNDLASRSTRVYPMASRCGVFSKTDIQNLIAKNVCREDIAASIFHAVAVQTVVTLAHGYEINPPILLCGGPLTFIPALRQAFIDYLAVDEDDIILPENGNLLPALGAALYEVDAKEKTTFSIASLKAYLMTDGKAEFKPSYVGLPPVFADEQSYEAWRQKKGARPVEYIGLQPGEQKVFIGIDSGSTTTKIVVTDRQSRLLYTYYHTNEGSPIAAVEKGLNRLRDLCRERGVQLSVCGCCSTGYGEDLIKAAFQLDWGIVETIAHYMAARHWDPEVSFILDIGGQDMKAIFVNQGVIDRIEINEACSSGCGSFIETFAKTLGFTASDFAQAACHSSSPCDLGTRCTVFMNSKVKQVLREGATVNDIAAGLAYSVVKNCLYKVLKLSDLSVLGKHVVVQGGTMRNDAVVRAFELLTGLEVTRSNVPELMGALGCALYSAQRAGRPRPLDELIDKAHYTSRTLHCQGCDNRCLVVKYKFDSGRTYYSGNRCEKVFSNSEGMSAAGRGGRAKGENVYLRKQALLFDRTATVSEPRLTLGIPRVLNMFEDYPFWHTLFTECGINVCLSDPSNFQAYEKEARKVMSDNICFPAKLVHGHIRNLVEHRVDRIFMPFVVFEKQAEGAQNSFNCPIVSGYAEVVKAVDSGGIPVDAPAITFKDRDLLLRQCVDYLHGLGVNRDTVRRAFTKACEAQDRFAHDIVEANQDVLCLARQKGEPVILLAGRPYHTDPLIQHKVSELLAGMGIHVITDDIVRESDVQVDGAHFLPQWAYPDRILQAAQWCAEQDSGVQFVEMTSFGCGPDAFLVDEVRDLLTRHHKVLTLLKLDDINNVGSMKLRVRSLVESLKLTEGMTDDREDQPFHTVPIFSEECRGYKILVPYFTPFLSPFIPAVMRLAGYDMETLPMSDAVSADYGLKYANNEVCYPATLIVGDIIKAFKSGRYDPHHTAVAMSQTGGQCRASNYVALIKKALVMAGYDDVPVVSFALSGRITNNQPGFRIKWSKFIAPAFASVFFSDCIAKFYYPTVVRETIPGEAARLKDKFLNQAVDLVVRGKSSELYPLITRAAAEFNAICAEGERPRVGIVGEIFLKFNPFAQHRVTDWLIEHGIEPMPPVMADFFLQSFVNSKAWKEANVERRSWTDPLRSWIYKLVKKQIRKVNRAAESFRYFIPFGDVFDEARTAEQVITLNAQFGEGWLLPAEILTYHKHGVNDVVSLQPFGCIANHIVARGIERRIRAVCPEMNILSLDFDGGVSAVNVTNRMLLFINRLKAPSLSETAGK